VLRTVTTLLSFGMEHRPSPCGWAESSLVARTIQVQPPQLGRVRPSSFHFFLFQKIYFWRNYDFPTYLFYAILINIDMYFYIVKIQIQYWNNRFSKKNIFVFMHRTQSLKAKKRKKNHIVFSYNKENFNIYIYIYIYILACILALITSLLKSRELSQYFKKKSKKIFCFVLMSEITNLYVKRIPDIKEVVLL